MTKAKQFINSPETAVSEVIRAILLANPISLVKVKDAPSLIHSSYNNSATHPNKTRVSLLSGGGSGHEPSHAGYISPTMLSGAIFGGMFASPSVSDVLSAILAVSVPDGKGCILIVKNYTGDRLNFGMAAEKAKLQYGIDCSLLVVSDDCAVPRDKGITGRRGVAGTVFVHKVCGALASQGAPIEEILEAGRNVAQSLMSIGVALYSVTIPGAELNTRLEDPTLAEVGLGIHGEPGSSQVPFTTSSSFAKILVDKIAKFGYGEDSDVKHLRSNDNVVVLVNNLGGCSVFELNVIANDLHNELVALLGKRSNIRKFLVGTMMTSFNMVGASLSVLKLPEGADGDTMLSQISLATDAKGWISAETRPADDDSTTEKDISDLLVPNDKLITQTTVNIPNFDYAAFVTKAVKKIATEITKAEPDLTSWDLKVGDGDCGITMKRGANALLHGLESSTIDLKNPITTMTDVADIISSSMGGTSGALFEIFFRVCGRTIMEKSSSSNDAADANAFSAGFVAGVEAIVSYGGAKEGYSTMLDALLPASRAVGNFEKMKIASAEGAENTKNLCAKAGRANYINDDTQAGVPDPGAMAVSIILASLCFE